MSAARRPKRRPDTQQALAELVSFCRANDDDAVAARLRKVLSGRQYRLIAKAAEICAERLLYALEPDLLAAYEPLLDDPAKRDPQCTAKGAIARALVTLDCQNVDFFLAGMRYRQPEPVWGGSVDRAVDLRCTCAMGLVGTPFARALVALATLLQDAEPQARAGAVRAIACVPPFQSEALLRFKALVGDPEPTVTGECLAALLQVEPDASPPFVAQFLDDSRDEVRELAALALGESRLGEALAILKAHWEEAVLLRRQDKQALLRAAVLHRSPPAFDWLVSMVEQADEATACQVIESLAIYRENTGLKARVEQAVKGRGVETLTAALRKYWERE